MENLNDLLQYWEVVFIYVFKYLKDIDYKLDLLHTDNAVKDSEINNIKKNIDELKGWIHRVESKIDDKDKGE